MKYLRLSLMAVIVLLLPNRMNAQTTLKDATDAYNQAVQTLQTNKEAAIQQFEKAIQLCQAVGPDADSLLLSITPNLPSLYYDVAYDAYKAKKLDEALIKFQKTIEVADKYGDDRTKKKAEAVEPQLYYAIGVNFYKADNTDKALENLQNAVKINPQFTRAWLVIGLIYRKKEDVNNMMAAMDKTIEAGKAENDLKSVEQATKVTRDFLVILANKEKNKDNLDGAIEYLNKAIAYDANFSDSYYLMAAIYNKQSKWQDAVTAGKKALDLAPQEGRAKIQYELGVAYVGLNQTSDACAAFKEAAKDKNFEASAKFYIEQKLKCQ